MDPAEESSSSEETPIVPADTTFTIRRAVDNGHDVHLVLGFIKAIAEYEKLADQVEATIESLTASLFDKDHVANCLLAYEGPNPVGFALYFFNFSTFIGRKGLYLEDLFIQESHRKKGYGKKLLENLAQIATFHNCARMDWVALNWNTNAINFYKNIGASTMDGWTLIRMERRGIEGLAEVANERDANISSFHDDSGEEEDSPIAPQ
eukprot:TRINITY_DN1945_c0_g1_i1.p1 TRINITY_DN1945_c0_g1~~TRINITY_DN1945_c0_g1_i1.p1  ORF type:complete len:228 (-),score=55.03 TRINITY_DN1945_c0_g1_i1:59-679(-)